MAKSLDVSTGDCVRVTMIRLLVPTWESGPRSGRAARATAGRVSDCSWFLPVECVAQRASRVSPAPLMVLVWLDVRDGQRVGDIGQRGRRRWSVSLPQSISWPGEDGQVADVLHFKSFKSRLKCLTRCRRNSGRLSIRRVKSTADRNFLDPEGAERDRQTHSQSHRHKG